MTYVLVVHRRYRDLLLRARSESGVVQVGELNVDGRSLLVRLISNVASRRATISSATELSVVTFHLAARDFVHSCSHATTRSVGRGRPVTVLIASAKTILDHK